MLVDYNPFKDGFGAFHITAGFYAASGKIVEVTGQVDRQWMQQYDIDPETLSVEIGDSRVFANRDGSITAYAKASGFKPYLGIGWGNAIPKGRVGFRFDIGAMFQGKPEIGSPNVQGDLLQGEEMDDVNRIMSKVKVWPQISFQLTYRILKD